MKKKGSKVSTPEVSERVRGHGQPQAKSERRLTYEKARFGEDFSNPLLWHLINAKNHLEISRVTDPHTHLLVSLVKRVEGLGGVNNVHGGILLGFFEATAKAILEADSVFFHEVARLVDRLDALPQRRMDLAVIEAYVRIRARSGLEPTKRQVRTGALEALARENVIGRMRTRFIHDLYEFPSYGAGPGRLKPHLDAEVQKEADRLPRQNWTIIFKRCGLSHLPADKGGQPSHSRRRPAV